VNALALVAALALAVGCSPGSPGTGPGAGGTGPGAGGTAAAGTTGAAGTGQAGTGASGTSGTAGAVAGTTGSAGATAGTTGSAGRGGGAGTGATAGTGGAGGGGTTGAAGTGGSSAGATGTAGVGGTSGTAGASGGRGGGGAGTTGTAGASAPTCNGGPPSPPTGGASFPFPQHRASGACIYPPTCTDADMATGWQMYKSILITSDGTSDGSLRVKRPDNGNDTVSESISYGMLFAVYMNDKATFDGLLKYQQKHLDTHGLMNWHINSDGTTAGANSATDADEDIAFALVMADKQWGGYTTVATNMLTTVASNDFGTDGTIKGGDTYVAVNPSYLAPAFYRVFAGYGDNARWTAILDKSYQLLASAADPTTGLVPDWSAGRTGAGNYTYDATRTPFRIALDACWSGDSRAIAFSQKIGTFFAGVGVANIKDGYNLNGTATGGNHNSSFVGPAGASGMPSNQAKLVADAYAFVVGDVKSTTANYYDRSWALFATLLMTGNFINFAAY
jgi:endo-1,4-beta-D-glucanase Y